MCGYKNNLSDLLIQRR